MAEMTVIDSENEPALLKPATEYTAVGGAPLWLQL